MLKKDRVNWYCTNVDCMNQNSDVDVFHMIAAPHCAICGRPLTLTASSSPFEMPAFKSEPGVKNAELLKDEPIQDFANVPSHYFDKAGKKIADDIDAEVLSNLMDPSDGVLEWMRCRDGIDTAEIALKGFCQEIGANVTEGQIADICRKLQTLVHSHYGLGD